MRDKLGRVEVARRVGEWIGQPPNAERVTAELATAAKGVVTVLRDEDVQEVIDQVLVRKLLERPAGPPLGAVLEGILNDGAHHRLVDLVCDKAYDWVDATTTPPCCGSSSGGRRPGRPASSTGSSRTGCSSRSRPSPGR